jgi:hypothetical protein
MASTFLRSCYNYEITQYASTISDGLRIHFENTLTTKFWSNAGKHASVPGTLARNSVPYLRAGCRRLRRPQSGRPSTPSRTGFCFSARESDRNCAAGCGTVTIWKSAEFGARRTHHRYDTTNPFVRIQYWNIPNQIQFDIPLSLQKKSIRCR